MLVSGIDDKLDRTVEVCEGGLYLLLGILVQALDFVDLARVSWWSGALAPVALTAPCGFPAIKPCM